MEPMAHRQPSLGQRLVGKVTEELAAKNESFPPLKIVSRAHYLGYESY
jgi:hypothetical protein